MKDHTAYDREKFQESDDRCAQESINGKNVKKEKSLILTPETSPIFPEVPLVLAVEQIGLFDPLGASRSI